MEMLQLRKYFLGELSMNHQLSLFCFTALQLRIDFTKLHTTELIEREIVIFYKRLYENYDKNELVRLENDDDFFKELAQVPTNEVPELIKPISLADLTATLHSCGDSAPGPDGIPYSILGLLWPTYGNLLVDAWNYSIGTSKLPPSHKL